MVSFRIENELLFWVRDLGDQPLGLSIREQPVLFAEDDEERPVDAADTAASAAPLGEEG